MYACALAENDVHRQCTHVRLIIDLLDRGGLETSHVFSASPLSAPEANNIYLISSLMGTTTQTVYIYCIYTCCTLHDNTVP